MALVNAAGIKLSNFKNILTMQATRDCCGAGHLIVLRRKQQQRPRANRSLSPSLSAPAFHHYYITVFQYSSGPHRPFVRTVSHVTKLSEVAGKPAAVRRLLLRFVCPGQFCNVRERCDAVLLQLYMAVVIFLGDLQSGSPV
jgi:hypothetical protein